MPWRGPALDKMSRWLSLAAGFLAGGFSRYFLASLIYSSTGGAFPYGTLVVNVTGCFLIGIFDRWRGAGLLLGPDARLLLMTGFCGAYTTFSALMIETSHLADEGQVGRAMINFFGSGALGLLLFRLGSWLGKAL